MDDAGMRRALSIFHAVVDLEPVRRSAAVDAAVGTDAELGAQVRAMLLADEGFADPQQGVALAVGLDVGATIDRYVVRGRLGQGGAAEVYAVEHRTLRTKHALKVLHSPSSSLAPRLMEEGRIQARLRHPHIVRVTDVVPVGQGVGLVMDLVPGRSLRESLDAGGLPPAEALRVAEQVLSGVAAAHAAGLVHRDLKPDNVLLEDTPAGVHARVADFGIARAAAGGDRPRTRTGVAMGTPGYMAPEQYRDAGRVGPQADVFSLACLIHETVTGRPTFSPGDLIEMFRQAEQGLFERAAGMPAAIADVLAYALSPDPARRFPDAGEMLVAWRRACAGGSIPAPVAEPRPTPGAAGHSLPTMSFEGLDGAQPEVPAPAASQVDTLEAVERTLLLTDVVDSTAMAEALGDARMASVWLAHDRVARDLLPLHNGLEIDKTDGFLLLFEDTPSAVAYAVAYHAALRELSTELEVRLAARAGVHRGPVILRENGAADVARGAKPIEVEGLAKPTAARTMSVAGAGQTLMTAAAAAALGEVELTVRSHGHWRLKGVALPVELFEVGDEDAPFLPPEDGAKVYRVVEVGGEWRPARDVPNNLPPVVQASFGRARELRDIGEAFERGARLVTLLGPGGTGKTHLALRHARAWRGDHPGGTWLCDLSEARTLAEVTRTFGVALGVPLDAGDPLDTLGAALASRGRVLLVVDNLEQVEVEPEALLGGLLRAAPEARLLATSRHRLGVRGEHLLPLEPLPLPERGGPVQDSPAVAMFIDRARAASPRLQLDAASLTVIARLVNLLDGLPLAIELAAARVRVLSPARILERMGRRLDVLKRRGGPSRQATLRAAIDGSWELLSPVERAAFAACAVFEGSFDLEAAEAVFDFEAWPEAPWADEVLESLVDKSLVRSRDVDGEVRFSLFRHLHDYATERLGDPQSAQTPDGEAATGHDVRAALELRHAEHFSLWGDAAGLARLRGPEGPRARASLVLDLDNVAAAVRRAAAAGAGDVASAAAEGALALLRTTGPFTLAEELAGVALAAAPAGSAGPLRIALGEIRSQAGRADEARPLLEAALASAQERGEPAVAARALAALGQADLLQGALESARARYESARDGYRRVGDLHGEAGCLRELAHVIGIRGGRLTEAEALVEQARDRYARVGDPVGAALTESYAGALSCIQGELEAGRAAYERAGALARSVGDRRTEGLAEGMVATVRMLQGELDAAGRHYDRALTLQRETGDRVHEVITAFNHGELRVKQGRELEARAAFTRVVDLARAIGDPLMEGNALGWIGTLEAQGDPGGAVARLAEAESRLEAAGDPIELAKLRCKIGEVALRAGDRPTAETRLAEVQAVLKGLSLAEDGELAVAAAALEAALA